MTPEEVVIEMLPCWGWCKRDSTGVVQEHRGSCPAHYRFVVAAALRERDEYYVGKLNRIWTFLQQVSEHGVHNAGCNRNMGCALLDEIRAALAGRGK